MSSSYHVIHVAREPRTGVWAVMKQLARAQLKAGYSVSFALLLTKDWPETYLVQLEALRGLGIGIVTKVSPSLSGTLAFLLEELRSPLDGLVDACRQNRSGQVIVHHHNAWLAGALSRSSRRGLIQVSTYHGIQGERKLVKQPLRRAVHRRWAQLLLARGVRVVSVDRSACARAAALFGVPADSFVVVPNGSEVLSSEETATPYVEGGDRDFTVGHLGLLHEGKGWEITLNAVASMRDAGVPVRFLIAGDGPDKAAVARAADLHSWVEYCGYSHDPVGDFLPNLDALILPSLAEGLPMAIIEAMSLGIPVLATDVGGIKDAIGGNVAGMIIDRQPDSVRNAILQLVSSLETRTSLARGARERHMREFSVEAIARRYSEVYGML